MSLNRLNKAAKHITEQMDGLSKDLLDLEEKMGRLNMGVPVFIERDIKELGIYGYGYGRIGTTRRWGFFAKLHKGKELRRIIECPKEVRLDFADVVDKVISEVLRKASGEAELFRNARTKLHNASLKLDDPS